MLVNSLNELNSAAKDYLNNLNPADTATVLALYGDLGAGKTAFVKELGKELGVKENIVSPTFNIMKVYETEHDKFQKLIHIDAYRLEKDQGTGFLGLAGLLVDNANIIAIEWPDNLAVEPTHKIFFKFIDENTREINYEK